MAKIELSDISSGYNLSKVNENFQKIEDALNDEVLYRDNPVGEDNALQTDIDANNKRILNLPDPVSASEPIRKQEWDQVLPVAEQYKEDAEQAADEAESWATIAENSSRDGGAVRVDSIKDLATFVVAEEGQQFLVSGYHEGTSVGGGLFVWTTGRHNGGTFIDPNRAFPTDWNDQAQLTDWFADSGVDVEGFERVDSGTDSFLMPEQFGSKGSNDKTANGICLQKILDYSGRVCGNISYYVDREINVPDGAKFYFRSGGISADDGFLTSGTGKSLLVLASNAEDVDFIGLTFNGGSSSLDFGVWPNTDSTGNEASVGLTRPVKLIVHQSNKNIRYKGCSFLNSVGGAVKEFGTFSGGTEGSASFDDCYWNLIRGNCIDGEFSSLKVTNQRVNLIGDIRSETRGGLVVASANDAVVTDISVRQTTDSTIYLTGTGKGRHVVGKINILYSGKDAVKVLNATDNSLFGDISVTAAGRSCVGFFGGTISNGIIGTIKIGFTAGNPPTDILDQTDTTWSTPKTITACNIQEPKWDQGGGNGGVGLAVADSNTTFSTVSISSYTGSAVSLSATKVNGGVISVNEGDGAAIYATTSSLNLDSLMLNKTNQDVSKSVGSGVHAVQLLGSSNINVSSVEFSDLGGGLIYTGPDTTRTNLDCLVGSQFNTESNSDAHLLYLNSASSPYTVGDVNISSVSVSGSTTAGRILWARNITSLNIGNWSSTGGTDGIRLSGCVRANIANTFVKGAGDAGFRASTCQNLSTSCLQAHDNTGVGIKTDNDCTNVIVLGSISSGNATNYDIQGTNILPSVVSDFNI